jgi:SAM-dependent methyltransferase
MTSRLVKKLTKLWTKVVDSVIVAVLPAKYANLFQSSWQGQWNKYFADAEVEMQSQWDDIIWPLIKEFDFDSVLELAPGAGRNTERLCQVSKRLYAVDYNAYAIEQSRERLGPSYAGCAIEYHVNNGSDISMIADDSISAIYCWDAAVHFDKDILGNYVPEFARVLRDGGKGFVHHSNLGDRAHKNIKKNPGWRSNMSKESFAEMCRTSGLRVVAQVDIPWRDITDCITVFEKSSGKQ